MSMWDRTKRFDDTIKGNIEDFCGFDTGWTGYFAGLMAVSLCWYSRHRRVAFKSIRSIIEISSSSLEEVLIY